MIITRHELYGKHEETFNQQYRDNLESLRRVLEQEAISLYGHINPSQRVELNPISEEYFVYCFKRDKAAGFKHKNDEPPESIRKSDFFPIGWEIRLAKKSDLTRLLGRRSILKQGLWDGEQIASITYPALSEEDNYCFKGEQENFIASTSNRYAELNPSVKLRGMGLTHLENLEGTFHLP